MPRPKKKAPKRATTRKPRATGGTTELKLTSGNVDLTLRTSDSALIQSILSQFEPSLSGGGSTGGKKAPTRGRPRGSGRRAAKRSSSSRLTKADVAATFKGANPTNMEQRILLLGLAAAKKGENHFTTDDIRANAGDIGVSLSSIPGSLSKLKSQKTITVHKEGRRAYYSLTGAGTAEATRISSGETIKKPRGRKPGRKAKAAAKRPGRKPAAKLTKAGKPRKKPGPKPGSKRGAKKATAAAPKRRGRKPGPKPGAKKRGRPRKAVAAAPKRRGRKPGPKPGAKKRGRPRKAASAGAASKKPARARKLGAKRRRRASAAKK